jgi:hypothetical protein
METGEVGARSSQAVQIGSNNTRVNYFSASATVAVAPSQVATGAIPAGPPSFQPRAAPMDRLAEVVSSDGVVVVCALTERGPFRMSCEQWQHMRRVMNAMASGLVAAVNEDSERCSPRVVADITPYEDP